MLGKCMLFLGYSLDDVNIRDMMYKLFKLRQKIKSDPDKKTPSAYLVTFGSNEIQKRLLDEWNVTIIELDPVNKRTSIENFLKELL